MKSTSCLLVLALAAAAAHAQVPQMLSYQGKLLDDAGNPVVDGDYPMEFRFYDACVDGDLLLTDLHPAVQARDGIYAVMLGGGAVSPGVEPDLLSVFRNHDLVCLGVTVGTDQEMEPRQQIVSSGFALRSATADAGSPGSGLVIDSGDVTWTGVHEFDSTVLFADGQSLEWPHVSGDPPPQAGFRITKFHAAPAGQETHPNGEDDEQWMICYNCVEGATFREDASQHAWNQKIEATYWDGATESLEYNWNYTSPANKKWRPFAFRLFIDGTCSGSAAFCVDDADCTSGETCENANRASFSWNTRPDNVVADFELRWGTGRARFTRGLDGVVTHSGTTDGTGLLTGFSLASAIETQDDVSGPDVFGAWLENDFSSPADGAVLNGLVGLGSGNTFSGAASGRDVTGRMVAVDAWNSIEQTGGGAPTVSEVIGLRYRFAPTGQNVAIIESDGLRIESPADFSSSNPVTVESHFGLRIMDQAGLGSVSGDALSIDPQSTNPDPGRGNLTLAGGGWNDGHLRLGDGHVWMDSTAGVPRFSVGAPAAESDGTPLHSPPGTDSRWGGIHWGDSTSPDHNTGSKVCALAGLTCRETYEMGSATALNCETASHATDRFLALCH